MYRCLACAIFFSYLDWIGLGIKKLALKRSLFLASSCQNSHAAALGRGVQGQVQLSPHARSLPNFCFHHPIISIIPMMLCDDNVRLELSLVHACSRRIGDMINYGGGLLAWSIIYHGVFSMLQAVYVPKTTLSVFDRARRYRPVSIKMFW
jgi:hypothetical protein